jgi:mono/diheme cytochrome c family protein
VAFAANAIKPFNATVADNLLLAIVKKYPGDALIADAVISTLKGREEAFYQQVLALQPQAEGGIHTRLKGVMADIRHAQNNKDVLLLQQQYPRGVSVFRSTCQPCHGIDGNGVKSLAPPLNRSEWVTGNKELLSAIVLFGLTGPVKVNGILYQSPEINGDMPGIGHNQDLVNEDIAQLLSFIRNSWGNNAGKITDADILQVRQKFKGRQKAFTTEELSQLN